MSLIPPPMAVEAHHLPLFPSQLIANRDLTANTMDNQTGFNPLYSTVIATTTTAAAAADEYSLPRKRLRDLSFTPSLTGNDISFLFQQHQLELDWLIAKHVDEVVAELGERRRLFMKQMVAVVEEKVARWLKSKEEEMEKMKKLNMALEENVKSLCLENQIWRELAQSNEATANALRRNIKHLLVRGKMNEESNEVVEDAESCCEGESSRESMRGLQLCKSCHGNESSVLLLPCRHLCICVDCCLGVDVCPVCNCKRIGSINVNLS
ncbi:E3 ubiquitin-protein ligase BOI and related proteins protein [Dioscorea alata]|uniref:E3 ubiquitin-protein ligase BOI and related proteins protein n=1 Tax=Dioscorea alata TaxID=55571 RepID=A0ACB7U2D7_DIOAL|nr:E3 ubiquitin-protein ligase BOI and related proteins protein [Dioscorea alata]